MLIPLTPRQAEILALIERRIQAHGYPPTRSEIAAELGFSSANAAESHLRALAKKGYIRLQSGISRGIVVLQRTLLPTDQRGLPLVGRVAAGSPVLAQQNIEAHYHIDPALFHPTPDYLLRVTGLSMRDAGILDGDLLAVQRTPEASNGQIVVARIDDEVTVKRFRRQGHQVRLLPDNPDYQPIEIDLREMPLHIEGLAVGVLRSGMPQ